MPGAMARRPILTIGVCALAALTFLTSTTPTNLFATSAKAAPATGSESTQDTSTAAAASSKKRTSAFGPASLKMLVPAPELPILFKTQKETGTRIWTGRRGDWFPFFVTNKPQKAVIFTGEADEVCAAFKKFSETQVGNNDEIGRVYRFLVPRAAVSQLIGSGGENIQHVRDETGANIWIVNTPSGEDMVCMSGASQTLTAAAKWLLDALQGGGFKSVLSTSYHTHGSSDHETELHLHIPEEKIGRVIGKGGTSLAHYSRHSLCKLQMNAEKQTLKITGHLGDVEMAVRYIMQELSDEPK